MSDKIFFVINTVSSGLSISANIDAEEEMLELAPKYLGEIPVSAETEDHGDIGQSIDNYFGGNSVTGSTSASL